MYQKIRVSIIILGFFILYCPPKTQALDPLGLFPELKDALDQQRRKPLRGLPGVVATIEHIYPDIMLESLSAEHIRQMVTKLVKEAGIKTATVEDCAMYVADLRKRLGEQGQLDRKVLTEGPCAFPDLYVT
jgi:hypothetical protein